LVGHYFSFSFCDFFMMIINELSFSSSSFLNKNVNMDKNE
jgi:hypothetical protein